MSKNIAFIGAGNLAWHLAPALENAGFAVTEVYSRNPRNALELCKNLYSGRVHESLDFSESTCELYIICVSDDALERVATEIALPESAIVVHTSGSQPLSILGYIGTDHIGVLYPLQTFSKAKKVNFKEVPIYIEGDTNEVVTELLTLASSISDFVNRISTADRKVLHLAAVFACNFTNHLLSISKEIMDHRGLDFETLHPLISETINKSLAIGPYESQTGPAVRNDTSTLQSHLQYLSDQQDLASLYSMFSDSILQMHSDKK